MPDHFRQQPAANALAMAAGHHLTAPRSPPDHAENHHPLALVVADAKTVATTHHHHHQQPLPAHVRRLHARGEAAAEAPPVAHDHGPVHADRALVGHGHGHAGSPGRSVSSGFPSSPRDSPDRATPPGAPREDEEAPLALVVSKPASSSAPLEDSGHEDGYSGGDSPAQGSTPPPPPPAPTGEAGDVTPHGSGLKIRAFARAPVDDGLARVDDGLVPPPAPAHHHHHLHHLPRRRSSELHPHRLEGSDAASVSSIDTWQTHSPAAAAADPAAAARNARANSGGAVDAQQHVCRYCDKRFANKYHLASHLVTHTGERAFSCNRCDKTFGRRSTLRAHMTTHTRTSNFMCPLCGKACNDRNSLSEHVRMHTGEKPFVCGVCGKAYARKSHLNVHYRVHTGERPFVCGVCGKDFTERRFLNDHAQTAHPNAGEGGDAGPLR